LGYLQNIKSPDMYVKMMRTFMFRMPEAERDEACQEVGQHLAALAEDYEAEGHPKAEALLLAIERFGQPFRVGSEIARKWEIKRQRRLQQIQPQLARRLKWFRNCCSFFTVGVPILFVMNYHFWPLILIVASVHGLLVSILAHWLQSLEAQVAPPLARPAERTLSEAWGNSQSEAKELWKERLPQIGNQLKQSKSLWGRLNLYAARWFGRRAINRDGSGKSASSDLLRKLIWQMLGLAYLALLILWPTGTDPSLINVRGLVIFLYASIRIQSVSRSYLDKQFRASGTPQI